MTRFWAERAWLGGESVADAVLIEIEGGTIMSVESGTSPSADSAKLAGLTLPGFANGHSHAFHRVLRGRTHSGAGSFWTWRSAMYEAADALDPDRYREMATAVFGEMLLAGYTVVGEFHYLHHDSGGAAYRDPNAMSRAVIDAAATAGLRITLLNTCYLAGGIDGSGNYVEPEGVQVRFSDGSVDAWAQRADALADGPMHRIGAAIHSVRAVPPVAIAQIAEWAEKRGTPLHAHVSEQPEEDERSLLAHGKTPTQVLVDAGAVGPAFTAVHGTHLSSTDRSALGVGGASVCICPTTERDLGDGIGATAEMHQAGISLSIGSDSQAIIDPFEELRGVELHGRLAHRTRGLLSPAVLLDAGTVNGYRSLGWHDGGRIAPGMLGDLVTVRTDSPRLAGYSDEALLGSVVFAAGAVDVTHVVVGGEVIVSDGQHQRIDVVAELSKACSS